MRRSLIIVALFLQGLVSSGWAQDTTSLKKTEVTISTLRQKLNSETNLSSPTDTVKLPDSDSLKVKLAHDSVRRTLTNRKSLSLGADSIKDPITNPIGEVNKNMSGVPGRLDSLQKKINEPVDKLNKGIASAENQAQQKVNGVNQVIDRKSDEVQDKAQQKLDKVTNGQVALPDKKLNVTGNELDIPDTNLPAVSTDVPKVDIPSTETGSLKLPDEKLSVDQLKETADLNVPEAEKIKEATDQLNQVDSKLAEAEKYEGELQKVKNAEVPSAEKVADEAEKKVAGFEPVTDVTKETKKLTQQQAEYDALLQKYRDKKLLQQEIVRKTRNVASDKINQHSAAFKEAQEQIAKAKKLNPSVQSAKEIAKKRSNEMRDKPLRERLVPGVTLQVYTSDVFTIDWGAQLGYKVTSRLTLGAGGVYRVGISEDYSTWVQGAGVHGYRGYGQFGLLKGFYLHGEFESLSVKPSVAGAVTEEKRSTINSGYFGIGKRYDISRKLRGSIIVLYRAEFKGALPSMNKINLRVGFDYSMQKDKRVRLGK